MFTLLLDSTMSRHNVIDQSFTDSMLNPTCAQSTEVYFPFLVYIQNFIYWDIFFLSIKNTQSIKGNQWPQTQINHQPKTPNINWNWARTWQAASRHQHRVREAPWGQQTRPCKAPRLWNHVQSDRWLFFGSYCVGEVWGSGAAAEEMSVPYLKSQNKRQGNKVILLLWYFFLKVFSKYKPLLIFF